jgi:hypothetical protein
MVNTCLLGTIPGVARAWDAVGGCRRRDAPCVPAAAVRAQCMRIPAVGRRRGGAEEGQEKGKEWLGGTGLARGGEFGGRAVLDGGGAENWTTAGSASLKRKGDAHNVNEGDSRSWHPVGRPGVVGHARCACTAARARGAWAGPAPCGVGAVHDGRRSGGPTELGRVHNDVSGVTVHRNGAVRCVGDSPRGPLKQHGKPHLKPAKSQG